MPLGTPYGSIDADLTGLYDGGTASLRRRENGMVSPDSRENGMVSPDSSRIPEERNKERLEELCKEQGNKEYTEVMDCYYNVFVIENDQGAAAARKYLADQSAVSANGPGKATALKILTEYFDAKGTLLTREVAGLILIAGLEAQYPHVGGRPYEGDVQYRSISRPPVELIKEKSLPAEVTVLRCGMDIPPLSGYSDTCPERLLALARAHRDT